MYSNEIEENTHFLYRLMGLSLACTVLHIGAHPDDEDVGLVAYVAHKFGGRIVYWSATRGEGGQNRIGSYQEEALGIYRTWESQAVRAVDGGQALFGPFYDFGYSKDGAMTLAKWGQGALVREIGRAIRLVQPHIVVSRWTGQPSDEHGHHQAVGQVVPEAFEAAGDPEQFPELRAQGLVAWQPRKLYFSTGGDWQPGQEGEPFGAFQPALERPGFVRINAGEFDPIAKRSYQEQAWLGFNQHKTQAIGFMPEPGDCYYYFKLHKSLVPVPERESELFDGLDPSLTGLADYTGNKKYPSLRQKLAAVKTKAEEAFQEFRLVDPSKVSPLLLEALSMLRTVRAELGAEKLPAGARPALERYLAGKIADFEAVAAWSLGLRLECLSERAHIIPGQHFQISARLWKQSDVQLDQVTFTPDLPAGWAARPVQPVAVNDKQAPAQFAAAYEVAAPETANLSCPYWLAQPRAGNVYHWPPGEPSSRPFGPPQTQVTCEITSGPYRLTLRQGIVHREAFAGGFRELLLAVIPPISLHPASTDEFLAVRTTTVPALDETTEAISELFFASQGEGQEQNLALQVVARNNSEQAVAGILELEIPAGWRATPERVQLSLAEAGATQNVRFMVTVPADVSEANYPLRYKIRYAGRDYAVVLTPVRMGAPGLPALPDSSNCIKETFIITPSQVTVHGLAARFATGLNYAYIQGTKESLLETLKPFGLTFHLISDQEMSYLDLGDFDAIVVGPNAYLVRGELQKNADRFLDYAHRGGSLIVQYHGYGYDKQGFTPYPFRYSQPHDRVTYEDAPVTILQPDHMLFQMPNPIHASDFEGWIRERGLYFFGEWDRRYQALLACSDPGEEPKAGGLIECQYGRGTFLYTGYSFFRQLPAGVAGTFRLFANILALPTARLIERIVFLKQIPLFAPLADERLKLIAQIMSERWEKDGAMIARQGEIGDELYIIYQGAVEILLESPEQGQSRLLVVRKVGDCIGELSVLGNVPRTASMRARGDTRLLVIEGRHFQPLLRQYPDMAIEMIKILVDKLAGG